jgi:hypothetical protein
VAFEQPFVVAGAATVSGDPGTGRSTTQLRGSSTSKACASRLRTISSWIFKLAAQVASLPAYPASAQASTRPVASTAMCRLRPPSFSALSQPGWPGARCPRPAPAGSQSRPWSGGSRPAAARAWSRHPSCSSCGCRRRASARSSRRRCARAGSRWAGTARAPGPVRLTYTIAFTITRRAWTIGRPRHSHSDRDF